MAGGKKETPRQRMIGMMYLVLTALLALNVSRSVLEKFVFINSTLEKTVVEGQTKNNETLASIEKQVEDSGNKKRRILEKKPAKYFLNWRPIKMKLLRQQEAGMKMEISMMLPMKKK